jgi:hypothetical protein
MPRLNKKRPQDTAGISFVMEQPWSAMPQGEGQADSWQNRMRPPGAEIRGAHAKGKLNRRNRYHPQPLIAALYAPAHPVVSPRSRRRGRFRMQVTQISSGAGEPARAPNVS